MALVIGGAVIGVQLRRRRMFSLLMLAAVLFVVEAVGGALKALYPGPIFYEYAATDASNPLVMVPRALTMYIGGFLLFLYGYAVAVWVLRMTTRPPKNVAEEYFSRTWTPSYRFLLAVMTLITLAAGLVQVYMRIRNMGGVEEYAEVAYKMRYGTGTQDATENALIVVSNLLGGGTMAFAVLWLTAWLRGKLSLSGKLGVLVFLAVLMLRQYSTLLRNVMIFGVVSLFAAFAVERRLRMRPIVIAAVILAILFVGFNYVHLYMYYLTAKWDKPTLAGAAATFAAPQAHLYTLASIIYAHELGVPHLNGTGMKESMFFFVPRALWKSKRATGTYGTVHVQRSVGLPTHFQMAITTVGEMFAHFGGMGIVFMILFGVLYGLFDSAAERSIPFRAALIGILLPRVLADFGMGLSAISITTVLLLLFLGQAWLVQFASAFIDWVFRGGARPWTPLRIAAVKALNRAEPMTDASKAMR